MAAKKYVQSWEATFQSKAGIHHEEILLKCDSYDEGVRRATTAAISYGRRHDAVLLGMALTAQNTAWAALLPAVDVPN